ncbi:MAG TPA: hypothetical protein VF044_00295, partial [Actinomycetota bacterium]
MSLARLEPLERPLVAPVLLASFDGWVDAAGAASAAAEHLARGGELVAAFDADGDGTITIGVAAAGPRDDDGYYQSLVDFAEEFSADNG